MAGGAVVEMSGQPTTLHGEPGFGTNNEAEYDGVILALEHALSEGATSATICGDSQLIIRQLEGKYRVKAPNLQSRYQRARALLAQFEWVEFRWVKREDNAAADQAANDALDS